MQYPFESKRRKISLTYTTQGMRRFFERASPFMSPSLSMIRRCGSILWLNIASRPPPRCLDLLPYCACPISGFPLHSALANLPITALKLTTPLSLPSFEVPQTLLGPPTQRLRWQSCCRSVRTPAHVCGYDPIITPQRENPSQRPFCIDA